MVWWQPDGNCSKVGQGRLELDEQQVCYGLTQEHCTGLTGPGSRDGSMDARRLRGDLYGRSHLFREQHGCVLEQMTAILVTALCHVASCSTPLYAAA